MYETWVKIIITTDIRTSINRHSLTKVQRDETVGDAFFGRDHKKNFGYIIVFLETFSYQTLVHEFTHLVNRIYADRGVIVDCENDEHDAYFRGWLFDKINKALIKAQ
jgi:hypothetical protein